MIKKLDEPEVEDLRGVLTEFWLGIMQMNDVDMPDRMKASELLAKHVLENGRSRVMKPGGRPRTADVLRIAAELEAKE